MLEAHLHSSWKAHVHVLQHFSCIFLRISCSYARMHLRRPIWSLREAICMSLKTSIRKLNEHADIPCDRLPALEGKYDFYGGVDITMQPQSRMDSFGPELI